MREAGFKLADITHRHTETQRDFRETGQLEVRKRKIGSCESIGANCVSGWSKQSRALACTMRRLASSNYKLNNDHLGRQTNSRETTTATSGTAKWINRALFGRD